ncbi:MAG: sigma-70 family RNA polymerase sigma factor [Anaerolineae bacterium]|nr:sigma-70 family RNA polymerase sigma factor [Anaerolineae bacterium]
MNYDALSDEELVARMVTRDRLALDAIYNRYATLVFSLSVRILSEGMAAEEVTQDAFLSLWRRADHYSVERGRLLSWLLTIARNRAIDELRRHRNIAEQVELPDQARDEPDLEEVSLRRVQIRRALAVLPHLQRQAIELAYYGGMTQQEVADYLQTPLGTIKTRMRLGLQRLRDLLQTGETLGEDVASPMHPMGDSPT